ncbi:MAG: hypothetical protein FWD34_09870 [Oscillospiraceae bacterium]|nr:hypothetical protein [Oscillospiraceae bacterium]
MKKVLLYLLMVATVLSVTACDDDFWDISESTDGGTGQAGIVMHDDPAKQGEFSGDEELGSGFTSMSGSGELNSDSSFGVTQETRHVRRILKQDVYGRELPEWFLFYRELLNDNEKSVYDQIYANAVDLVSSFNITTRVHYSRLDDIIISVRYDNPDLFWFSNEYYYTYDGNGYITSIRLTFYDCVNNIEPFKQMFYDCADSVLEYVMHFDKDVDKIKYIHDLLTNINDYEWGNMDQSAYSALCIGKTVCAGYSMAFQYFMQRLAIPSVILYGFDREDHLWNMVYIDGDYYEIDITWNDPIGNQPYIYYYNYFNITTAQMGSRIRHSPSNKLPSAYGTTYNYSNYYGDAPGSDFSKISYGNPKTKLPPVYPDVNYSVSHEYAAEDFFSDEGWSLSEVEDWLYWLSDDEWNELWELLFDELDDEYHSMLYDMDWDEFVYFMYEVMNYASY